MNCMCNFDAKFFTFGSDFCVRMQIEMRKSCGTPPPLGISFFVAIDLPFRSKAHILFPEHKFGFGSLIKSDYYFIIIIMRIQQIDCLLALLLLTSRRSLLNFFLFVNERRECARALVYG